MPGYGDIDGLPPVTELPPDLASLTWPWDQAAPVAAPALGDAGTVEPAPGGAPLATAPSELVPVQPGIGIPTSALDAVAAGAPPSGPSAAPGTAPPVPDLGAAPPVAAAPAVEQPLTPAAGATTPVGDANASAQRGLADIADIPPEALFTPSLPPAPAPPAEQGMLPDAITGRVEATYGAPAEPVFTGDAQPGLTPDQRYAQVAGGYQANPAALVDRLISGGPLDDNTQRYLNEFAARDPAGFGELSNRLGDARAKDLAARRARIATEDFDRQKANLDMRTKALEDAQRKSAAIDAEATAIASTKIGYHPTTLQRIAGVIAAVVGGLYQGRTGSARNPGLDALNDVINRDLEEQRANLANRRDVLASKRTALADQLARTGDMYQAAEVSRLAALKHADEQLATAQQSFAPDGTRGLQIAALRSGINTQIAANKQARDQKLFDNSMKVQNAAREQQIADETARNNRAQLGLGYARINEDAEQRKEAREQRRVDKEAERADKAAERRRQFAIGGIPQLQVGADGKPLIGPDGKPVIAYDDLKNADGTVWEAESPEATRELRQKKTSASEVVSMIDEVRAIRNRVGGESKLLNSRDAQRLEVIKARVGLLTKAGTQGMSSDKDMERLEAAAGTSDADSWRDQEGKLLEARARTESSLNQAFRDAKYSGPAITFPEAVRSENTPAEDTLQHLIEKPNVSYETALDQALKYRRGAIPAGSPLGEEESLALTRAARAEAEQYKDISPKQRRDLVQLQQDAVTDPAALDALRRIAKSAHSRVVRDMAANAVSRVQDIIKYPDYPKQFIGDPADIAGGQ